MTIKYIKKRKLDTIYESEESQERYESVNKGINTDKQLKDYKIFVFDLDNTLYLHKCDEIYTEMYHKKVKNFLSYLKDNDKLLYIATHNGAPDYLLNEIHIKELFDGVIKEEKDVHYLFNCISEYTSKKDMIFEILKKHTIYTTDDVLFFDDNMYNIDVVNSIKVKSIYIDYKKGIEFNDIY